MKLILKWLKDHNACQSGIDWYLEQGTTDFIDLLKRARDAGRYEYFCWCYARRVKRKKRILWACYAAELVLPTWEVKHPDDDRPRKAIDAARKCAIRKTAKNRAAADAADAAANAANAAYSADAAAYAAAYAIMDYGINLLDGNA